MFLAAAFFLVLMTIASARTGVASTRYATCDACGYCPIVDNSITPMATCYPDTTRTPSEGGNPVPGNWKACVRCLYPSLFPTNSQPNPADCRTLQIKDGEKIPPTPFIGRQYTMIGCLSVSGDVFQNTGATGASSFVQAIFDLLVFRVIGGIAFLYLMYGSFLILTSQADPERLNYGRRVVIGAIAGLVFALGSVFIVNLIGSGILRLPGFSGNQ